MLLASIYAPNNWGQSKHNATIALLITAIKDDFQTPPPPLRNKT